MVLRESATTGALRRGSWWLRALQAVVLVGAAYYLITKQITPHWPDIRARQFAWRAGPLVLGSVIVLGTLTVLVGAWTASLRWCAAQITALDAAKVWFTANLARFLPGGWWIAKRRSALPTPALRG